VVLETAQLLKGGLQTIHSAAVSYLSAISVRPITLKSTGPTFAKFLGLVIAVFMINLKLVCRFLKDLVVYSSLLPFSSL